MDDSQRIFDQGLLDYELGMLGHAERAQVERVLSASPELQHQQVILREAFAGLDQWNQPAAPDYLVSQVLAGVASAERNSVFAGDSILSGNPASALPPASGRGGSGSGPILTIRELVAIAACITLFVGIFVPAGVKARNMAWKARCQGNLEIFMTGMAAYAETYAGQVPFAGTPFAGTPFAGTQAGVSWRRSEPGVLRTSNTRHPYLVVKLRFVKDPKVFICPTQKHARPMIADDYQRFTDVAEKANFAYAYHNMGGKERPRWGVNPKMVMMADASPLSGKSGPHHLSPYPVTENSLNHDREDGQNVLRCDGSVRWEKSPNVGVYGDNIWTPATKSIIAPERFGFAVPVSATDSFLINSE